MAYGVDRYPSPPELPSGHREYDRGDDGEMLVRWVEDFDDDDRRLDDGQPV